MNGLKAYQNTFGFFLLVAIIVLISYFKIIWFLILLISVLIFFYAVSLVFKTSVFAIKSSSDEIFIKKEQINQQIISRLPKVTVLLPLYKEETVVSSLIKNIQAQNYPTSKLDIKLLLEKDDVETIKQVQRDILPASF